MLKFSRYYNLYVQSSSIFIAYLPDYLIFYWFHVSSASACSRSLCCCNSTLPSGINKVFLSCLSLSYILTHCAETRCDGQSLQDLVKFYRKRLVPKGWLSQRCPPEKSSTGNSVNKQILPSEALKKMLHCFNGELCVIMNLHEIHILPFTHRFTH